MQQAPETRIGFALDGVDTHLTAFEGETLQSRRGLAFELSEGGHESAVGRAVKEERNHFGGRGKRKRVKVLAMLDVLVHVFDDVYGSRRGEHASVAERAMTASRAALYPRD